MKAATWADFAFDGALVDLVVPGTGPAEWEAFWTGLRAGPFPLRAFRDGQPVPPFETAAAAFVEQATASVGCRCRPARSPPTATSSGAT